jgi:GTP-binding protein
MVINIPSRGIIGLRNQLLTATAGEAIMSHRFIGYLLKEQFWKKQWFIDLNGKWKAIPYSIDITRSW